jgi:hypothetical protein
MNVSGYSADEVRNAFYYPGCGVDGEPLMRFTHLCRLFVYADWTYGDWSTRALFDCLTQGASGDLVPRGEGRVLRLQNLGLGSLDLPPWLTFPEKEREARQCRLTYGTDRAVELFFDRRIGNGYRRIKVLYLCTEGIAAYCRLFLERQVAPAVLCTRNTFGPGGLSGSWTGLEEPGGTLERLLAACEPKPVFWVRGGNCPALNPGHPSGAKWNSFVQEYDGWNYACAYSLSPGIPGLPEEVSLRGKRRELRLVRKRFKAAEFKSGDALFTSRALSRRLRLPLSTGLEFWPAHLPLDKALQQMEETCRRQGYARALMTPIGREDEGEVFLDWLNGEGPPQYLEVRFVHDLDYADIRGGERAKAKQAKGLELAAQIDQARARPCVSEVKKPSTDTEHKPWWKFW